ncbi:F0F1 ATP synthase subunit A [Fluviicola taffensis]|uniref:F0F1 ATP synthase subunit A n=1 Tax=Fluviicola taffensis TaxID=191579 RepID=UPI003137858A
MSLIFSAKRFFSLLVAILIFSTSFASVHEVEKVEKFHVGNMIMHHISDAHEWHLWGGHHDGVSIYLPIILMDGGLKTFSSKHFYHGEAVHTMDAAKNEHAEYVLGVGPAAGYAMFEEEIYKLGESGKLEIKNGAVVDAKSPLDFSITKNVLSLFMGAILILLILSNVARFYKKHGAVAPKGIAKYLEVLIVMVRDDIAKANIGEHKYKKYVPYLLTIFFFIFINNLLGLVPFLPGGANLTGNITVTLFLAVATLVVTIFSGNKNYWGHIFWMPGVPVPMKIFMMPIELLGVLTKPFALMIRLFANMTAGHVIVLAFIGIIFINENAWWGGLSVPMSLFISVLELLVAFLQAFLFAMLSSLFIGAAVEEAHH